MTTIILRPLAISKSGDIETDLAYDEELVFVVPLSEYLVLLVIEKIRVPQ